SADKEALAQALESLREYTSDFHLTSEFELYLRSLGYGPKAALTAFTLLVKACEAQPFRMDWLQTLRGYTLRLIEDDDEQYGEDGQPSLTPTAWAFQWELANASPNQLPQIFARHAAGFNDLRCEGLRRVAKGLLSPELGDEPLLAGLQLLARDVDNSYGLYGH